MRKGLLIGIVAVGVIVFMLFFLWLLYQYQYISLNSESPSIESLPIYCSEDQHHGFSTNGTCLNDDHCFVSGCNSEICQSKDEESRYSTCLHDPPYPKHLNCSCICMDNKCMWAKLEV